MNGRERILAAFEGQPTDSLPLMPITMMFAADQIGQSYGKYATDYRVLVDGQLKTAEKFDFDYVSCISDPAREAADCGARVEYFDDQPPAIVEKDALLSEKQILGKLEIPDPMEGERMSDRVRAAKLFKKRVGDDKLIEGWVEGPCAEAADLRGIHTLMMDFIDHPSFVKDMFEFTLEMGLRFAKAQIDAGCDLIGVGDAAVSLISRGIYADLILPYEKRLVQGIQEMGARVRLHICGSTRHILEGIGQLGADMVDLDFMVSVALGRKKMGPEPVIAGNLDPVRAVRDGTPESIQAALMECHRQAGSRYIVAAGCEIPRDTSEENVQAMTAYARSASSQDVKDEEGRMKDEG
ncbi:MAG: uroporphyrinogen decarboxylase family protein [Pirellulaceae bacterium]